MALSSWEGWSAAAPEANIAAASSDEDYWDPDVDAEGAGQERVAYLADLKTRVWSAKKALGTGVSGLKPVRVKGVVRCVCVRGEDGVG